MICGLPQTTLGQPTASSTRNEAGMVIAYGDGHVTYVYIAFLEASISAFELLERSGVPYVSVGFGGLGQGICSIGERGCGPDTCRRNLCQSRGPTAPFWHLFRQDALGEWQFLALGASGTRVEHGDILGWSWTADKPELGVITLEELRNRTGVVRSGVGVAVQEVYPNGAQPEATPWQEWPLYATGAAILLGMSGVGAGLVLRDRRARNAE